MSYERENPLFSLCGLPCCLCPRFHTRGTSRCPGCGGNSFCNLHPACAVITCNKKHDAVEYCFQCSAYPCEKYLEESHKDSFISYKNVKQHFCEAQKDFVAFEKNLQKRYQLLQELLENFDDGRSRSLYCLAANDMPLEDFKMLMEKAKAILKEADAKIKAKHVRELIKNWEKAHNYVLTLRKKDFC